MAASIVKMGRRVNRAGSKAKTTQDAPNPIEPRVNRLLKRLPFRGLHVRASPEETDDVCLKLSSALREIYEEFVNDLLMRMSNRIGSADPLGKVQDYKLCLKGSFRTKCISMVQEIEREGLVAQALTYHGNVALSFVISLRTNVLKVDHHLQRIKVLEDACFVMKNAASEMGKIVNPLYRLSPDLTFEAYLSSQFQAFAVNEVRLSLDENTTKNSVQSLYSFDFDRIYNDPQFSMPAQQEVLEEDEGSSGQCLCRMSIDELVAFIEESPTSHSPKKKRRKGDSTRSSSPKNKEEDSEFEALLARLKNLKPAVNKVKPILKPEWMQSLRESFNSASY
jgi:hypothetical protein